MVTVKAGLTPYIRGKPIRGWPPLARDETIE